MELLLFTSFLLCFPRYCTLSLNALIPMILEHEEVNICLVMKHHPLWLISPQHLALVAIKIDALCDTVGCKYESAKALEI